MVSSLVLYNFRKPPSINQVFEESPEIAPADSPQIARLAQNMVPSLVRLPRPWIVSRYLFKLKKTYFVYCRFLLLFVLTAAKNQHQLSISNVTMLCIHVLFVLDCPSCLLMAHSSSFSLLTQQWMLFKRHTVSEVRYSVVLQLHSYIDPALIKSRPF